MKTLLVLTTLLYSSTAYALAPSESHFSYQFRILANDGNSQGVELDTGMVSAGFDVLDITLVPDGDPVGTINPRRPFSGSFTSEVRDLVYQDVGAVSGIESLIDIDLYARSLQGTPIGFIPTTGTYGYGAWKELGPNGEVLNEDEIITGALSVLGSWTMNGEMIPLLRQSEYTEGSMGLIGIAGEGFAFDSQGNLISASRVVDGINYRLTVSMEQRFSVIPEPGTALLMGLGLAGLAAAGRRDKKLLLP